MSTYEELSLIVSVALLIISILNYTHKNSRPALQSKTTIFIVNCNFHRGG